jgi:hypothetical protein
MRYPISMIMITLCGHLVSLGQVPITNVFTNYSSASNGVSYVNGSATYKFGNLSGTSSNKQNVVGFSTAGGSFFYNMYISGTIKMRRVNNSNVSGRRTLVWMESSETTNNYKIFPPYNDSMEWFFDGRYINQGTDNLFGNQGDGSGNNNNIERVDWIAPSGLKTNEITQSGFAVFERGADNDHDPFCIAAILTLDADGYPASYGPIVRVTSADFGNIPNSGLNYTILRKEETESKLYRTSGGTQKRGGVYITFQDLGIAVNEVIFGYSLIASDLPSKAKPPNLVNFTNTTNFPRNTASNTLGGGIDLIAITGLFNSNTSTVALPLKIKSWNIVILDQRKILSWKIENTENCDWIEIERSVDGREWKAIAKLLPNWQNFTDEEVTDNKCFYRLKLKEKVGDSVFSDVKMVQGKELINTVRAIADNRKLNLSFVAQQQSECEMALYSLEGKQLCKEKFSAKKGANLFSFDVPDFKGPAVLQLLIGKQVINTRVMIKNQP